MDARADRQRLCRLLEPAHGELRRFARRLCRSSADGDDLFQEASLRALTRIGGLRDDGAFRPWFYRILITVHRNRARRGFWSRVVPLGEREEAAPAEDVGGAERMRLALSRLPAPQREAIVLFELQELGVEEVAAVQGVSRSAVKSRLSRGRKRLRSIYRKHFALESTAAPITGTLLPGGNR